MPPSDTYFTTPPEWGWLVILYFFFGGIAGGSYFVASLIDIVGNRADHRLARIGYFIAFPAVLACGPLLILDLTRPERFLHMLFQSETGGLMFKWWSPMSVGAWALLTFGAFSLASFLGALEETGRVRLPMPAFLRSDVVRHPFNALGTLAGFFLASYTGVLLSVTNGPIWADSTLIGLLFLASAASTGTAALLLVAHGQRLRLPSLARLRRFDAWAMELELVVLFVFVVSLGAVAQAWLSLWGLLLVVGVLLLGILIPLALHRRPRLLGSASPLAAGVLVLLGGFVLRAVVVLSSQSM